MLYVDLTNYGKISGFKEDQTPQNPKEFALANSELGKKQKKPGGSSPSFSGSRKIRRIAI